MRRGASAIVLFAAASCSAGSPVDATAKAPTPAASPAVAQANSGAEWIEWYRALGPAELHRRTERFLDTQRPPPAEYLDEIANALRDRDRDVRALAAFALASLGKESVAHADRLREALHDADPFARFAAAVALESVTDSGAESIATFAELLHAPDPADRARAAGWVAGADESGGTSVPELDRALATESDPTVRRAEAEMLAALAKSVPAAALALRGRLDDGDARVRASALAAQLLDAGFDEEIARRCVVGLGESDAEARFTVASALNNQIHEFPEAVRRALRAAQLDADRRVRHAALLALSNTRRERKLVEWEATVVAAGDPDPLVREYAVFMMSILHQTAGVPPPSVLPVVARLAQDPDATPDPRWRSIDPDAPPSTGPAFTYGRSIRSNALDLLLEYGDEAKPYAACVARVLGDDLEWIEQSRAALFLAGLEGEGRPYVAALRARARRVPNDATLHGEGIALARIAAAWAVDSIEGNSERSPELRAALASLEFDARGREDVFQVMQTAPLRPALLAVAGDADATVRAAGLHALSQFFGAADPDVGARLAACAHDADVRVRRVAAGIASRVRPGEETGFTSEVVTTLADDPDEQVRAALGASNAGQ